MSQRKLTSKQQVFLDALLMEEVLGDIRLAMSIAGYSQSTKVVDLAKQLRAEIREASEVLLALHAPKAVCSILQVLEEPTALGARNTITAAKEILDRVGINSKTALEFSTATGTPVFILPPKSGLNDT